MVIVKFTDGEIVQGGGWDCLPNKPIQKIALVIAGHKVIMQNYECYNHLQEYAYAIIGNTNQLRSIYLMGKKENLVQVVRYNFLTSKFEESIVETGLEYNGRSSTGWKKGTNSLPPEYKIF